MIRASPTVQLIGAPTDVGASTLGARLGPDAFRVASIQRALEGRGLQVVDAGNLQGPANPQQPARRGYRHLPEVAAWNRLVHEAVAQSLHQRHLPVLLGGDHSLAIGSIGAVAQHCRAAGRTLRVLWLDAHADFNTPALTPSGNLHGMPAAVLCGLGPAALRASGPRPALRPSALRLIGVRSVDPGERQLVHAQGLEVFDMRHIDEWGMRHTLLQALSGLDDRSHLHLSFDVDFLDPATAPGVGTPVPGGPTWREAQLCMEMIADTGRLGSLDVMELNPARDQANQTAERVIELLESLFGKSTLMRRA